jgi:hypothetical protein
MNLDELINKIVSEGCFPIRVKKISVKDTDRDLVFVGDLDGFLKAAKAMKTEVIFVASVVFDEDEFKYEFDEDYDDDDDDDDTVIRENETIYLPSVMPSLDKFKKYIGQDYVFRLSVITVSNTLDFYIRESWWDEFFEMQDEAVEKINENREAIMSSQRAEREAKQKEALKSLKMLINDAAFINLRTQTTMRAYAIEKIPELEDMDQATLRSEIQNLNAKIEAKGLGRKR